MWPFRRTALPPADADRLATLSRRLDDVEAGFRKLHGEWTDVEERLSRMAGRLAKRAARELERLDVEPPAAPPEAEADPNDEVAKRRRRGIFPGAGR